MWRRILLVAGIVLVIFILFIALFRQRGARPQQDLNVKKEATSLTTYANTDTEVRYTLEGKINGREDHRALQITVGKNWRTVTVFYGYQGAVLRSKNLQNDFNAYQALLSALENSGYTKTRVASRGVDPLSACPLGQRYHYDIINNGTVMQTLWSTACSNVKGTFAGQASTVRTLFQAQIPEYNEFIKGVTF